MKLSGRKVALAAARRVHPLELTRQQPEAIRAAAHTLPPEWRQRFLGSVADSLEHFDRRPTDDEVRTAISGVRWTLTEGTMTIAMTEGTSPQFGRSYLAPLGTKCTA